MIGSFDAHWHGGAPPMILIAKEAAATLREALPDRATMTLRATRTPGGPGYNAVGYLRGEEDGAPIVIGAHHDGWFRAAFDNATGVAALLAIARGFAATGHRPRHTLCFTSRTAEEYGLEDSPFDWCIGAWRQVQETHPEWGGNVPFHLCLEASGHPELRLALEAPAELREWARASCHTGRREGWLPTSWRVAKPGTGTELWPYLVSGVPGITVLTWEKSFMRSDYHTPRDTPALLDWDHLEGQTRFYAYLLLQADADPDGILDHGARAEELAKIDGLPAPDRPPRPRATSPPSARSSSPSTRTACSPTRTSRRSATPSSSRPRSPPTAPATAAAPPTRCAGSAPTRSPRASRRPRSPATRGAAPPPAAATRGRAPAT